MESLRWLILPRLDQPFWVNARGLFRAGPAICQKIIRAV